MKLSIITVNFNNVDGLKKTIDSVISQSFKDYEWIVIDGGSTDGSKELIEEYSSHFSYWVSEHDQGAYYAMNKGISHAVGEYVNFLNSGDCFASSSILSDIFSKEHTADILYGYMMRRSINGIINSAQNMKRRLNHYDFYFDTFGHQSTFTKRSLLISYGMFDVSYRMYADWHFFARAIVIGNASYEFIPRKISIYECGGISDAGSEVELLRIRKEIYGNELIQDTNRLIFENHLIQEFAFSRFLFRMAYKFAKKYKRHFHSKRIQQHD